MPQRGKEWDGKCNRDINQLSMKVKDQNDENETERERDQEDNERDEGDETEVSLITGSVRLNPKKHRDPKDDTASSSLSSLGEDKQLYDRSKGALTVSQSASAMHLASRSWRGLEQKIGETAVEKASQGLSGIASGYTTEPPNSLDPNVSHHDESDQ